MDPSSIGHRADEETLQDHARADSVQTHSRSRKVTTMPVPGSGQIQFPSVLSADFSVDQVTDPGGAPANVLDLDQGFAVSGHIDFPNWLGGTGNVSVYADQHGGGYNQKILTKDITITASPTDPAASTRYDWTLTYPTDLPAGSTALSDPSPAPGSMVYSLTAVFTFNGVPSDIAAFVDMGDYMIN
jgi:hypothetical protein